jgi:hypothetical protein
MALTKKQKLEEALDRVTRRGGVVVVTPHGVYDRRGDTVLFGFCSDTEARNAFIKRYCVRFTTAELAAKLREQDRRAKRVKDLAIRAIQCNKFTFAQRLLDKASSYIRDNDPGYFEVWYHLNRAA